MPKDNGGYVNALPSDGYTAHDPGITQRDYFAAQAMVGLLASGRYYIVDSVVERAYSFADEMIKQRGN